MKKKIDVHASIVSTAGAEDIFPLLATSSTYPEWSLIGRYESLRPGPDGIDGVGALRLFQTGSSIMREEIVEVVPNERVSYTLLSGFPLLDYLATTSLTKAPKGTLITWRSTFYPRYPSTGLFWRGLMMWVLGRMVRDLAKAAEDPRRRLEILGQAPGAGLRRGELAAQIPDATPVRSGAG